VGSAEERVVLPLARQVDLAGTAELCALREVVRQAAAVLRRELREEAVLRREVDEARVGVADPLGKITGVRVTGPAAPKPITGEPRDASVGTAKPGGNDVPTVVAAPARVAPTASTAKAARKANRGKRFTTAPGKPRALDSVSPDEKQKSPKGDRWPN
jgi:hypothetical protein